MNTKLVLNLNDPEPSDCAPESEYQSGIKMTAAEMTFEYQTQYYLNNGLVKLLSSGVSSVFVSGIQIPTVYDLTLKWLS